MSRSSISFWVSGVPAPGGSKKFVGFSKAGKPRLIDTAKGNKHWRALVANEARIAWPHKPTTEPLFVRFQFVVTRPRSHFGTGRNTGILKASAPVYPAIRPDALKLTRSTEDAMSKLIYADDSQVIVMYVEKRYGSEPGCLITIERMAKLKPGEADVHFNREAC